jgi:integrase
MKTSLTDCGLFRDHLIKKGLKESSVELYADVLKEFLSEYTDVDNLDDYNNFLKEHAYDKRSYYYFYAIKNFIKWKLNDIGLKNIILKNLLQPKNEEPIKSSIYLSPKKRDEVISKLENDRHRIIFKIQNATGARIGDILRLRRGSISYENYNGKLAMKIDIIGKRGKRNVKWIFDKPLQDEISDFIKDHYLDDYYYFVDFSKSFKKSSELRVIQTNYVWAWQDLKIACYNAGVNPLDWSTHDFRRSISRDIWNDESIGKDPQLLQQFLGHARVETTLRYIKNSGYSNQEVAFRLAKKDGKI